MSAYLFDTNAISETFRPRPNRRFTRWLDSISRDRQFTSTVVIAELYAAAWRAPNATRWHHRIESVVLPAMTVLPFDLACASVAGRIQADLMSRGQPIGTADVQIAATALVHDLVVVTANRRHFDRVPDLRVESFEPGQGARR